MTFWNNKKQTEKRRAGFTLSEALIVVAIILILALVAMLSLTTIRKNLRQKELDSKAEIIYVAAQNRIAELRASGFESVYQPNGTNGVLHLDYTPCDAETATTLKDDTLCYVSSDHKGDVSMAASTLLPESSVDAELRSHDWRIEFDPSSGSIYGVFYSESNAIPDARTADDYRIRSIRLKSGAKVGYYGGDVTNVESADVLKPEIRIINDEKLTATFYCNNPTASALTFTITLSDGKNTFEKVVTNPTKINSRTYSYTWVLDSLESDSTRFYNQTNNQLTCGTTLNVKLTVSSASPRVDDASSSVNTNSLFADPRDGADSNTALIAYGRHLQNLDSASHVSDTITKAVQISDISFADDTANDKDWYSYYNTTYCYPSGFHPIRNDKLTSYNGFSNLGGTELYSAIYSLNIQKPDNCTDLGLFEHFTGSITSVTLTGAKIGAETDGNTSVGTLVGRASGNLTLENCRTFLNAQKGDLTGLPETSDPAQVKPWLQGGVVGGLIGTADAGTAVQINTSLAASALSAAQNAGGLIGVANGTVNITTSYADCYLKGNVTGGLVGGMGTAAQLSLENFYAAGYQTAATTAAGLVPGALTQASNGYAAFDYSNTNVKIYSTAASGSGGTHVGNVYYLSGFGGTDVVNLDSKQGRTYKELSDKEMLNSLGSAFTLSSGDASFPYNLLKQGLTYYTYPRLTALNHYGDWQAEFESGALVYYEAYQDGSYGFSGGNTEALKTQAELNNTATIGDGYAIAYDSQPADTVTVTAFGQKLPVTPNPENTFQVTDSKNKTYYLVKLPTDLVNPNDSTMDHTSFYQHIAVNEDSYFFNPYFAKTVTVNEQKPEAPKTVSLRTARHLYALSRLYPTYAAETSGSLFQQELNIDYGSYRWMAYANTTGISTQRPITSDSGFVAEYDGGCYTIRGVSFMAQTTNIGMFGLIAGRAEVRNVFLLAAENGTVSYGSVAASGSRQSVNMGALAGSSYGSIRNCAVSGYKMTYYGYRFNVLSLGGLVGTNYGTIRGCEANTLDVQIAATNASSYAGGFAGTNYGSILSSYALGHIGVKDARNATVWIAGFTANNAGGIIRRCYSATALTASGTAESYGFARTGGAAIDCYYLDGGTYSYAGSLYAYNTSKNAFAKRYAAGTAVTGEELINLTNRALSEFAYAASSYDHSKTGKDTDAFPYPAIVSDAGANTVHYGDWPVQQDIGTLGVFYWEYESGGSNSGYHFSYVGTSQGSEISSDDANPTLNGNSLCTAHNDGGVVTAYGYGYFYLDDDTTQNMEVVLTRSYTNSTAAEYTPASEALALQMPGYKFVAYKTGTGAGEMYLNQWYSSDNYNTREVVRNDTWTLSYREKTSTTARSAYTYTINPFFADSMHLDKVMVGRNEVSGVVDGKAAPGASSDTSYQIRSVAQLQYINWNTYYGNATTSINSGNYKERVQIGWNNYYYPTMRYPYLLYASNSNQANTIPDLFWKQTHDVNAAAELGTYNFTPIGSLYDSLSSQTSDPYTAFFASTYDGQAYTIKNVAIDSTAQCIGLFGITAGASLKDIVMYTDNGSQIINNENSTNWYCVGGLVGFAASAKDTNSSFTNCSVSGYTLVDNQANNPGWGGGNVGGLVGSTNMDISKCTAVTDIIINIQYANGYMNLRVGGVAGVCRATISSCYAGGSITSTTAGTYYGPGQTSSIWVGGIVGGIVLCDKGTLGTLLGTVDGKLTVRDSYSYVQLPEPDATKNRVRSSQSIASNGELMNNAFRPLNNSSIDIINCYCLDSAATYTDDYTKRRNSNWNTTVNLGTQDQSSNRAISITNYGNSPYLTYDQMSDFLTRDGLLSKLGGNENPFSTVTTTEHNANIDGKYSFPGNDASLNGLNYPFPTILQQTDPFGQTVNVHYGAWPKSGLLWQENEATLDLLADVDENSGVATLDWKLYDVTSGASAPTGNPQFTFAEEDADPDAKPAEITTVTAEIENSYAPEVGDTSGYYNVRFTATAPGAYLVTAELNGSTAVLHLTITAELKIEVTQVLTVHSGEVSMQTITLKTAKDEPFIPDTDKPLVWTVSVDYDAAASEQQPVESYADEIVPQAESGKYTLPVTGLVAGEATINITCSYPLAGGTSAATGLATISTTTVSDALGLTNGVDAQEIDVPYTADPNDMTAYTGVDTVGMMGSGLSLYMTHTHGDSCLSLDAFYVTAATITTVDGTTYPVDLTTGFTVDKSYHLILSEPTGYVLPITIQTARTDTITLTLTLSRTGTGAAYTLSISYTPTATYFTVRFMGTDDTGGLSVAYQTQVLYGTYATPPENSSDYDTSEPVYCDTDFEPISSADKPGDGENPNDPTDPENPGPDDSGNGSDPSPGGSDAGNNSGSSGSGDDNTPVFPAPTPPISDDTPGT